MKIYSTKQVGDIFGVTAQTVKSWIKKNHIDCLRTTNQEYILTDENIEQLRAIIAKRYNLVFMEGMSNDNK